ncbi:lysozyme inhibitor LprI family protein [Paucimonas lemoignei]|uniref:lysozyme inhibitor LprI family protein n=1 Tax=Paucimonas lemoignei TaxID=29443 RepID=UPI0014049C6E|nr:lysozyme inhibitor LprI family protein [Paucimonas lemoignei]
MTRLTSLTPEEIRHDYNACDSGVTPRMKICASYNWVKQDVNLNRIYKRALAKAKMMGYESSLVKAQQAWLEYRDAACAFEGEIESGGGTAEGLYVLSCKESLTKERADRLAELLKNE